MDNKNSINEVTVSVTEPEKEMKKEKKKGGCLIPFLVTIAVILILGIGAISYFLFIDNSVVTIFMKPKEKVMYALAKAAGPDNFITILSGNEDKVKSPENSYKNNLGTIKNFIKIRENMKEEGFAYKFNFAVDKAKIPDYEEARNFAGAGVYTTFLFDPNDRKAWANVSIDYLSNTLIDTTAYVDDADLYFTIDDIIDGSVMINTETLSEDYYNSALYDEIGEDIPDISFNIIDLISDFNEISYDYSSIVDKGGDQYNIFKELYDSVSVEDTKNTETFKVGKKDLKCKEYKVIIPTEAIENYIIDSFELNLELSKDYINKYIDFVEANVDADKLGIDFDEYREEFESIYDEADLEDAFDELNESLEEDFEDFEINVYLDNKCRLIAVRYENTYETDDDEEATVSFEITWHGDKNLYDNYDGSLILGNEDEYASISFEGNATYEDNERTEIITIDLETEEDTLASVEITKVNGEDGAFNDTIYIDFTEEEESLELCFEGTLTETEKLFELALDDISITFESETDSFSVAFNGLFSMGVLDESIEAIDGEVYEIFNMNISEIKDLIKDVEKNIKSSPLGDL